MTFKENVRAILETNFSGFKDSIIDTAVERICELTLPSGEWKIGGKTTHYHYCSICGKDGDLQDNFCRNCGAKMKRDNR